MHFAKYLRIITTLVLFSKLGNHSLIINTVASLNSGQMVDDQSDDQTMQLPKVLGPVFLVDFLPRNGAIYYKQDFSCAHSGFSNTGKEKMVFQTYLNWGPAYTSRTRPNHI